MTAMVRLTVSAPRELIDQFMECCHARKQAGSEVLREFMVRYVSDAASGNDELAESWLAGAAVEAAALRTAGCDP
jgi:metal-responsive CopG/Arc/MetJ family transcriptional regulator